MPRRFAHTASQRLHPQRADTGDKAPVRRDRETAERPRVLDHIVFPEACTHLGHQGFKRRGKVQRHEVRGGIEQGCVLAAERQRAVLPALQTDKPLTTEQAATRL